MYAIITETSKEFQGQYPQFKWDVEKYFSANRPPSHYYYETREDAQRHADQINNQMD